MCPHLFPTVLAGGTLYHPRGPTLSRKRLGTSQHFLRVSGPLSHGMLCPSQALLWLPHPANTSHG